MTEDERHYGRLMAEKVDEAFRNGCNVSIYYRPEWAPFSIQFYVSGYWQSREVEWQSSIFDNSHRSDYEKMCEAVQRFLDEKAKWL